MSSTDGIADSPAPKRQKRPVQPSEDFVEEEQEVPIVLEQVETSVHHYTTNFMLGSQLWNLLVARSDPSPTNQMRSLCLNAVHLGGSKHMHWQRKDVKFSLTLVNQANTPRCPFTNLLNLEELRKPDGDFNVGGKLFVRVSIKIKMPLPPASLRGDVELQLDTGEAMRVHSLLLELASSVLSDALKVARDAHSAPDPLQPVRLPLPSTTIKEARILLLALYSAQPETAMQAQSMQTLKDLAHVSHRWACLDQFKLADACLTGKCGAQSALGSLSAHAIKSSLSTTNALYWYRWAKQLGLDRFEAEVAWFIGAHFHELQFDEVSEGSLAHLLQRATSVLPSRQEVAFIKTQLEKVRELAAQPASGPGAASHGPEIQKAANAALSRLSRLKPD